MLNELGLSEDISCLATVSQYNGENNIKSTVVPTVSEAKVSFRQVIFIRRWIFVKFLFYQSKTILC